MAKLTLPNYPTEKEIQNSILDFLQIQPQCIAWPTASVGLYDPTTKGFRRPGKHFRRGVADILGIWRGLPLAIEVKTKIGRVTKEQTQFLVDFESHGGVAFVARSLEDVIKGLCLIETQNQDFATSTASTAASAFTAK